MQVDKGSRLPSHRPSVPLQAGIRNTSRTDGFLVFTARLELVLIYSVSFFVLPFVTATHLWGFDGVKIVQAFQGVVARSCIEASFDEGSLLVASSFWRCPDLAPISQPQICKEARATHLPTGFNLMVRLTHLHPYWDCCTASYILFPVELTGCCSPQPSDNQENMS